MAPGSFDETRDYAFADQALALRKRAGLTQRELADQLGVTSQSVHTWEAGISYPGSERLKQLIAFYLEREVLESGREEQKAAALWETVREGAKRHIEPFDSTWFASLRPIGMSSAESRWSQTNLPPMRTSFVGRTAELAHLTQELDRTTGIDTRLLTLTGTAGSGKTRLALAVAESMLANYPDGVWFIELAPLLASPATDPVAVAAATLAALRLHEVPGRTLLQTLLEHLETRCLLLVLDNCEHVVAASAALTAQLLPSCPKLQILTTSQYPLGTPLETIWRVDTLNMPPAVEGTPTREMLDLLEESEAVQLFVERAQAARPGFELSVETAASIASICRRLDGLPLAIELAAARLDMLPVDELLTRLTDRFRLLRRGSRTAADRHQTLQATMDWSFRLLESSDRAVLRRLAVFTGGWEVSAAEAVCAGGLVPAESVLEVLDELLARSLVHTYTAGGTPRYGMLETVRHYGFQQLHLTGEMASARDRHLSWCVTLAERAAPALLGQEQIAWLARLERDHDNLRAALQWALDRGLSTLGLRLAAGLWQFWRSRGNLREGRRWLEAALALPSEDDDPTSRTVRATVLERAAWLAEDDHAFTRAAALFAQSDALRRALGQDENHSGLQLNAAMEARARGDYERATGLLQDSLAQHRAEGNRGSIKRCGLGLSLQRLALVLAEQGEYARAGDLYEECLALHRELGDREGIGKALLGLGDIARDLGETARVRAYCEETLALFRELEHNWVGFSLNNLALADYLDGDLARATEQAEESAALFRRLQAGPSLAEVLVTRGRVRGAQGAAEEARTHLIEALSLVWADGPRVVVAAALEELAVQAVRQGKPQDGVHCLASAAALRQSMGAPIRPADAPAVKDALATARASLDDATFTDAWAEGQTRTRDWLHEGARTPWEEMLRIASVEP
jgi:non-specific serine/threonine protein kinase